MKLLYHLYNSEYEITHAEFFEEGQQPSNAVFIENNNFVKPKINIETGDIYESANAEEMEFFNLQKVPQSITPLEFWRSVYRLTGLTEDIVVKQIEDTIPEPPKVEILIMLKKAIQFERSNPELIQMASNFGINSETLDQIFINA